MRADLRTAPHAERDVSVLGLKAREARLKVPVVVDDRSVAARCLDLVRGAPLEQHVARRGAHAQAIERRVGRRYSSAEGLHETGAAHVVERDPGASDVRDKDAVIVVQAEMARPKVRHYHRGAARNGDRHVSVSARHDRIVLRTGEIGQYEGFCRQRHEAMPRLNLMRGHLHLLRNARIVPRVNLLLHVDGVGRGDLNLRAIPRLDGDLSPVNVHVEDRRRANVVLFVGARRRRESQKRQQGEERYDGSPPQSFAHEPIVPRQPRAHHES
jgi:hypothetical protein